MFKGRIIVVKVFFHSVLATLGCSLLYMFCLSWSNLLQTAGTKVWISTLLLFLMALMFENFLLVV